MTADATAVSLRGLRKTFGDVTAVDGIDLDLAEGEFFSMLGPSGSGKTTVLRMIAGFEVPTAGRILLGGVDVTDAAAVRAGCEHGLPGLCAVPAHECAAERRVRAAGEGSRPAERRTRAVEALSTVRLEGYGDRRPSQLSGGQRQRVALARALVNRPKVLLLDEPLGALDLKLRREMQLELKALQRDVGITFVFVTHDQEEALTMSDRIAVFNDGRIEQLAVPAELYEHPASAFVAGFVGTSNLLEGEIAATILGTSGLFTVRPEKIQLQLRDAVAEPGLCTATGVVREVVYLGSATQCVVDLDAGGSLIVLQQNAQGSVQDKLELRGAQVRLTWHREHTVAIGGQP